MSKSNGITSPVCPYMVNTVIVWVQKDVVFKIVSWEVGRILEMFVKLNIFSSDVFLTARGRGVFYCHGMNVRTTIMEYLNYLNAKWSDKICSQKQC